MEGCTGREQHRVARDFFSIRQCDDAILVLHPHSRCCLRRYDLRAEPPRLGDGAMGEVAAGDAHWKAQVILDLGTAPGLTARRISFDQKTLDAITRRVDGRRDAGWTGADNDEFVEWERRVRG